MFRLKTLKYALPMVAFLAVSAISSTPAKAEWQHAWSNGDGVTLWYNQDSGKWAVTIEQNGKFGVYFEEAVIDAVMDKIPGSSNPNPDDPNNGKGTFKPDIVAMIKDGKGGSWNVPVNPEDSPMGGVINGDGGGKVPHWNPGGDESGNPSKPGDGKSAIERYNEEQKAKLQHALEVAAREAGKSGMGMFDGSEGGSESWGGLKPHGGIKTGDGKGKDDDGENKDGSDYKDPYVPKGEDLGAKPEIVNPTPDGKKGGRTTVTVKVGGLGSGGAQGLDLGKKGGGGDQGGRSGKGSTQGLTFNGKGKGGGGGDQGGKADKQVTNVMSPGLLDGGNGLAFNGPAGAGSAGGHVGALRGGR